MKENAKINVSKNGPLVISGLANFNNSQGMPVEHGDCMRLCRCGASKNKPFCDDAHITIGFEDAKRPGRLPDRVKDYAGQDITIHDNRGVCSHAAHCTDNSPKVFRMNKRPWIDPDGEEAAKTKRTIRLCPSGALSYDTKDEHYKDQDRAEAINIEKNGPYRVVGGVALADKDGNRPESREHYTLCRCGAGKNKPFCDGTHWQVKFEDEYN